MGAGLVTRNYDRWMMHHRMRLVRSAPLGGFVDVKARGEAPCPVQWSTPGGDVVIDAGAHVGTFCRTALRRGARLVVAFEPQPDNAACFKRNFAAEIQQGRVVLVEAALWDHTGVLTFAGEGFDGRVLDGANPAGSIQVPATTLDAAVQSLRLDRVDFIKARFAPRMVICIYHRPDAPQEIPKAVLEARPQYRVFSNPAQAFFF